MPLATSLDATEVAEIHRLYAEYCYALDGADGPAYAACFVPDGELHTPAGATAGHTALSAFAAGVAPVRHHVANVLVDGDADGEGATGRAYFVAYRFGEGGTRVIALGRYEDVLVRRDGRWRFAQRRVIVDG